MAAARTGWRGRVAELAGTVTVVIFCLLAVVVGRGVLASRAEAVPAPEAVAPQIVQTARIEMQDGYHKDQVFIGQVQPSRRSVLGFELGGTIAQMLVDEGDRVAAGQAVARLDDRLLRAERDQLLAARAAVAARAELAGRTSDRQNALGARGFASAQALDGASLGLAELAARLAELDAGLAALDIRLEKTAIRTPFAGTVAQRLVDQGATVAPGQPVLSLVEDAAPRFRVGLTPAAVADLAPGTVLDVLFDGVPQPATLQAILPELDPATRTRTVIFRLAGTGQPAYRGKGTLILPQRIPTRGAWVPIAALKDGPRGLWSIFTLTRDAQGQEVIGLEAVQIIHATADRVYVRGTFQPGMPYVTDGLHRVVPGQPVRSDAPAE